VERLRADVRFARGAKLNGYRCVVAANGPGAALAREAASIPVDADAVISTGFCGATNPDYRSGEVFVATEVNGHECAKPATDRPHRTGILHTADCVVNDKGKVRADAVDMEARTVAEAAEERQAPFYCIRSVLDTADERFVLDFNRLRDETGRFSRARIAAAAIKNPGAAVPELVSLIRRGRACSRALGDFIADCKF
jgi:nucleoside phosphorylase